MVQKELSHEESQTLLRHFEKEEKRIGNKNIMGTMHKLVLAKKIDNEHMTSLLEAKTNLETKAKSLVQAALDAGGEDNITIVIAEKNPTVVNRSE